MSVVRHSVRRRIDPVVLAALLLTGSSLSLMGNGSISQPAAAIKSAHFSRTVLSPKEAERRRESPVAMRAAPLEAGTNAPGLEGKWHSIEVRPRADLPKIRWYDKLNPIWWFKNSDEPIPPNWYLPHDKRRVMKWHFRNPLHNFDHYVIGVTDKRFVRSGRYPERISNPHGGWEVAVVKYKWARLPFVSYQRGKLDFYLGWRERGDFGIKLNIK